MSTTTKSQPRVTAPKDGMPSMIAYLTRVLKTPTIGAFWEELAGQARDENWSHEEYLAALLQRQVADRESKGTRHADPHRAFPHRQNVGGLQPRPPALATP